MLSHPFWVWILLTCPFNKPSKVTKKSLIENSCNIYHSTIQTLLSTISKRSVFKIPLLQHITVHSVFQRSLNIGVQHRSTAPDVFICKWCTYITMCWMLNITSNQHNDLWWIFQVAEGLLNPFGEDDDDLECNYVIDKNLIVGGHEFFPQLNLEWIFKESDVKLSGGNIWSFHDVKFCFRSTLIPDTCDIRK